MANKELRVKIQDAYDTEFNWKTNDPVLLAGQVAFSSDKYGKYKVGDGAKTWKQLEYATLSWNDITEKPSTFNPPAHTHTISQISDIGNANVKHANTAGSANAVAWANVSGKPSTFNPATHNHDDRYYTETEMNTKLGEKANTTALTSHTGNNDIHVTSTDKTNWNSAKAHADKAHAPSNAQANQNAFSNVTINGTTISADVPTDTLNLVAGSNVQITPDAANDKITISATDTKYTHPDTHPASMITQDTSHRFVTDTEKNTWNGKANANHTHEGGVIAIDEKSTTGTRYVKIADFACSSQYQRINQQILLTSREESILLNLKCQSSNSTKFTSVSATYTPLSSNSSSLYSCISVGLINVDDTKNRLEIWYKQGQWGASLNIIPLGKNKEGYTLTYYQHNSTEGGSASLPTFATNVPLTPAITKNTLGLSNVDNTADSQKSVKYATSAGSATTASKLGSESKGSATQPIYLNAGVPTACTYTLGKSVPSNAVFTDTNTWIALKGATTTDAGTAGYAPAPSAGAANRYLRSDGTWAVPPDTNTTYGVVSTTANGLAPKRDGSTAHFLRGDGTWATPPNTTYAVASGSTNGLMSSTDKTKLDGIATGANKYVLPTAELNALGGVKTTSQVTSSSGYTACPIIGGVPYYKDTNTTYTLNSFGITATAAELNFCDGVTSNIQTQLNGKAASSHTHSGYAPSTHTHTASQITGLPNVVAITNSQIDSLKSL